MQAIHDRVTTALDLLTVGLRPFVQRELQASYGENWSQAVGDNFSKDRKTATPKEGIDHWDAHMLLSVMWDQWNVVFRHKLGHLERSLVSELREFRNQWAHQVHFDLEDGYRILDSVERLLKATSSPQADRVARQKEELLQFWFREQPSLQTHSSRDEKNKRTVLTINMLCASAIILQMILSWGRDALLASIFVITVFVYLTYRQLVVDRLKTVGPQECSNCRKIIYTADCPYCQTTNFSLHSRSKEEATPSHSNAIETSQRSQIKNKKLQPTH